MTTLQQGVYEIELHIAPGREEVRLSDHLPRFLNRQELVFDGRRWRIVRATRPELPNAKSRLICVPVAMEASR